MKKLQNGYVYEFDEKLDDLLYRLKVLRSSFKQYSEIEEKYIDLSVEIQQDHYEMYPDDTDYFYVNELYDKTLKELGDSYDSALEEAVLLLKKLEPRDHMEPIK